jgi:hypothetical protein|tara:strand:+ start:121976 stop:122095 length:120 start_codon:yes stop_codon:yes gene_type:complete
MLFLVAQRSLLFFVVNLHAYGAATKAAMKKLNCILSKTA